MTTLIIYSKEKNAQCTELRDALNRAGIHYHEMDIHEPEAVTELKNYGFFTPEPPVLQVIQDKRSHWFFKKGDLFRNGHLKQEVMTDVVRISRAQTSWPY